MSSVCKLILVTVCIVAHTVAVAQFSTSNYEVGVVAGALVYQGDLSRSFAGDYKSIRPNIGLYVSKTLDPYFSIRANLLIGKVAADETKYQSPAWKQFRSFKFSTSITELSSTFVFNVLGDNNNENTSRLSPYVFAGAGVGFVRVKRDWSELNRTYYDLKSAVQLGLAIDTVRATPKVIGILPIGLGLHYALGPQFSLNAEATYRFTSTDYLDGFKYSGNPRNKDNYYGVTLGLSYRLGGYNCPPARK